MEKVRMKRKNIDQANINTKKKMRIANRMHQSRRGRSGRAISQPRYYSGGAERVAFRSVKLDGAQICGLRFNWDYISIKTERYPLDEAKSIHIHIRSLFSLSVSSLRIRNFHPSLPLRSQSIRAFYLSGPSIVDCLLTHYHTFSCRLGGKTWMLLD